LTSRGSIQRTRLAHARRNVACLCLCSRLLRDIASRRPGCSGSPDSQHERDLTRSRDLLPGVKRDSLSPAALKGAAHSRVNALSAHVEITLDSLAVFVCECAAHSISGVKLPGRLFGQFSLKRENSRHRRSARELARSRSHVTVARAFKVESRRRVTRALRTVALASRARSPGSTLTGHRQRAQHALSTPGLTPRSPRPGTGNSHARDRSGPLRSSCT
jgi:hypothetical protein